MKSGLNLILGTVLVCLITAWPLAAQAQSSHLSGIVSSTNPQSNQLTLRTEKGDLTFTTSERTQILHGQQGTDPKTWPKMTLAEISAGDEVVAYFRGALEQKPLLATS